jgi:hypothetical protein
MSHDEWLNALVTQARQIASREFQEQNWFREDIPVEVNWVNEAYENLDDLTFDLFFERYSKEFTSDQLAAWVEFKDELERYGKALPKFPDVRQVFDDPGWQRVREAAARFVMAFEQKHREPSIAG